MTLMWTDPAIWLPKLYPTRQLVHIPLLLNFKDTDIFSQREIYHDRKPTHIFEFLVHEISLVHRSAWHDKLSAFSMSLTSSIFHADHVAFTSILFIVWTLKPHRHTLSPKQKLHTRVPNQRLNKQTNQTHSHRHLAVLFSISRSSVFCCFLLRYIIQQQFFESHMEATFNKHVGCFGFVAVVFSEKYCLACGLKVSFIWNEVPRMTGETWESILMCTNFLEAWIAGKLSWGLILIPTCKLNTCFIVEIRWNVLPRLGLFKSTTCFNFFTDIIPEALYVTRNEDHVFTQWLFTV